MIDVSNILGKGVIMREHEKEVLLEHQELLEKYGIQLFLNNGDMVSMPRIYRDMYILTKNTHLTEEQREEINNFTNKLLN